MKNNCFSSADILLAKGDKQKWSVIACDQYTSEPEYWQKTKEIVGSEPSALNIILPEVYLEQADDKCIDEINDTMKKYLANGVFEEHKDTMVYIERVQSDGKIRRGLLGKIDLTCYDYNKGTTASVRATEETVLERIPPRVRIRRDAVLEMPHIMLLIDDPDGTVIEPLAKNEENLASLYNFELMQNGGKIEGRKLSETEKATVDTALEALYERCNGLLFCVGDGNHSLATAKACYELNPNEKSRYALVEVVNIHEEALQFEPIYRAVFGVNPEELIEKVIEDCGGIYEGDDAQKFTCIYGDNRREISLKGSAKLCVGTLQASLDRLLKGTDAVIDYIHGEESLEKICKAPNTVGFLFKGMEKSELFPAVLNDGSLPRKTFSMGHADDKRFYLEARVIK